MDCITWFVHAIVAIFSQGIWKNLVEVDVENQLKLNVERGFLSCKPRFYVLQTEKLPNWMARTISKRVWIEVHNFGRHCRPITLDMAYFLWAVGGRQWYNVLNWSPIIANLLNGVGNVICGYLKSLKFLNTITIHGFLSCPNWLPSPPWLMNSYLSLILKSSQSLNIKKDFFNFFHLFSTWLVPLQSDNFRLEFIYFLCIEDEGKKKHICYVLHHDAIDVRVAMNVKMSFLN
jgi:hypothetical protein